MAGGIRESQGDDLAENHEINVTPFIDVILVLLIIFMVAAPLATVDVNVDLPVSNATPQQRPDQPVYVTVQADKTLNIGNDLVPLTGQSPPPAPVPDLSAARGHRRCSASCRPAR